MTIEMRIAEPQRFAAESVKSAVWLAAGFGLLKYALATLTQIAMQNEGYDVFRDELYFIVCGRHLAWGYVDQPPVIPLVARISELLFGLHSLALFRTFASLAGAAEVAITGLLAWRMGGSRWAQALAMTGILLAPMAMGASATFSTTTFEPLFWMTVAFALMELARLADRGVRSGRTVALWWVLLGVAAGMGLENKWNEVFFLTCLLAALLMTSQRKLLASKWFPIGLTLLVLLILPNLLWEMQHHWATLELLHNDQINGKNVHMGPLPFLLTQIQVLGPLMAPLWIGGILWLLFGRSARMLRFLGVTYVLYLPLMMILHAKDYYLAAIYPLYFAAGAAARDLAFRRAWLRRRLTPAIRSVERGVHRGSAANHTSSVAARADHCLPGADPRAAAEDGDGTHCSAATVLRGYAGLAAEGGHAGRCLVLAAAGRAPTGRDLHGELWRRERGERVPAGCAASHQRTPELLLLGTAHLYGQRHDRLWRKPQYPRKRV